MKPIERRLALIEADTGMKLPYHLPLTEWTDDQLATFAVGRPVKANQLTDDELKAIAAGGA